MSEHATLDAERILVRRCLAGDPDAVRAFVDQYQRLVFSLCWRMLGHQQDAEDVAQEVLVRAVRGLSQWDGERRLVPWLLTIAGNRCRTHLSRRRHRPAFQTLPEQLADPPGPAPEHLAEELQHALLLVREEYRLCFILFHQQELSVSEIARSLDIPVGTVKTWLFRVRKQLAEHLRRRQFGPASSGSADTSLLTESPAAVAPHTVDVP